MCKYGYMSYTPTGRRDERVIEAILAILPCDNVVVEQLWDASAKRRPAFDGVVARLRPSDALYVHSIDKLGGDEAEVVRVWRLITQKKQADIVVLNDPVLNTRINRNLSVMQVRNAARAAFERSGKPEHHPDLQLVAE